MCRKVEIWVLALKAITLRNKEAIGLRAQLSM